MKIQELKAGFSCMYIEYVVMEHHKAVQDIEYVDMLCWIWVIEVG